MAIAPRQRPREALATTGITTGDDLPLISYEQYYECGWPSVVQTATVEYKFEILTKGLEADWARGGSGGAYGDSNDLASMRGPADAASEEPANLLESLNSFVPAQAQSTLGVEECHVEADATQRVFDGTFGGLRHLRHRKLQGQQPSTAGIVQIIARGSRYDDDVGECTSSLQGNGNDAEDGVICTPLKSFSTVVYDPKVTNEQAASQVAMTAISEAVTTVMSPSGPTDESRLQGAFDTSIFANNVVGIQVTDWNENVVESDVVIPIPSDNSDIATSAGGSTGSGTSTSTPPTTTSTVEPVDVDDSAKDAIDDTNVATPRTESGKDSLSSGAIAGITISLLLLALAVVAMLVVRKRRRRSEVYDPKSDSDMGDNTTYNEKTYDLSLYEHPTGTGLSTFEENEMISDEVVEETTHVAHAAGLANAVADVADTTLEQNDITGTCCFNIGSNGRSMGNVN